MANFDHQSLEHLKKLCRIECTEEESADILGSLDKVLSYVAQLDEVQTESTAACRYVLRGMLRNRMRSDEVQDVLPREQFLANPPDQIGGMIRVPPVLKASS